MEAVIGLLDILTNKIERRITCLGNQNFVCRASGVQTDKTLPQRRRLKKSAYVRFFNWTMPSDYRAVEVDTAEYPVNYQFVDGVGDVSIDRINK